MRGLFQNSAAAGVGFVKLRARNFRKSKRQKQQNEALPAY